MFITEQQKIQDDKYRPEQQNTMLFVQSDVSWNIAIWYEWNWNSIENKYQCSNKIQWNVNRCQMKTLNYYTLQSENIQNQKKSDCVMNWWLKFHEKRDWENQKSSDVGSKIFTMKTDNSKFLWNETDMNQFSFLKNCRKKYFNMKTFWIKNTEILILKSFLFVYDKKKNEKRSVRIYYENICFW